MRIYKTTGAVSGNPEMQGKLFTMDTIKHGGKYWLVPEWLTDDETGWTYPARIIQLDCLPHDKSMGSAYGDFQLKWAIPYEIWNGKNPDEVETEKLPDGTYFKFVVKERPKMKFRFPNKLN